MIDQGPLTLYGPTGNVVPPRPKYDLALCQQLLDEIDDTSEMLEMKHVFEERARGLAKFMADTFVRVPNVKWFKERTAAILDPATAERFATQMKELVEQSFVLQDYLETEWVRTHMPVMPHPIGTPIKPGVITGTDPMRPATYTVRKQGGEKFPVKFENAHPCEPREFKEKPYVPHEPIGKYKASGNSRPPFGSKRRDAKHASKRAGHRADSK